MEVVGTLSDAACVSSTHLYDLCVVKGVPLFFGDQYFILDKKQQQQKKVAKKKRVHTHGLLCRSFPDELFDCHIFHCQNLHCITQGVDSYGEADKQVGCGVEKKK